MKAIASSLCAALLLATLLAPAYAQSVAAPFPTVPGAPPVCDAFARAWANVAAYSATVTVFEQKGTQIQNSVFEYDFRKPSNATVHLMGPYVGVTIVWSGGLTVAAHRGAGLMALFKKTFSLHDPQMTTIRGLSVDQASFGAILAHAQQTPGTLYQGIGEMIDGVVTDAMVFVPAAAVANSGLTQEIIEVSASTHLPMRVLGFEGPTLVRVIDFSNVRLGG